MVAVPKGATVPEDHQKSAAQIEAEGIATLDITFGELTFAIPATVEKVDGEFLRHTADRDVYRMIEDVLSPKQFGAFRAQRPLVEDYRTVADQIAEAYGMGDSGN